MAPSILTGSLIAVGDNTLCTTAGGVLISDSEQRQRLGFPATWGFRPSRVQGHCRDRSNAQRWTYRYRDHVSGHKAETQRRQGSREQRSARVGTKGFWGSVRWRLPRSVSLTQRDRVHQQRRRRCALAYVSGTVSALQRQRDLAAPPSAWVWLENALSRGGWRASSFVPRRARQLAYSDL